MSRSFGTVNGLWPGNVPQVRTGEALRAGVARNPLNLRYLRSIQAQVATSWELPEKSRNWGR